MVKELTKDSEHSVIRSRLSGVGSNVFNQKLGVLLLLVSGQATDVSTSGSNGGWVVGRLIRDQVANHSRLWVNQVLWSRRRVVGRTNGAEGIVGGVGQAPGFGRITGEG